MATVNVTANDTSASIVTASLTNGACLQAHFTGGTPPALAALNPTLSVAAGASVDWTVQALVVSNGAPFAGQTVAWQAGTGIRPPLGASVITSASGVAAKALQSRPARPRAAGYPHRPASTAQTSVSPSQPRAPARSTAT